jgi:serine beta-lactamase-like protein LACTB
MEENVLGPLELTHTQSDIHKRIIANRAKYYRRDKSHFLKNSPYVDLSCKWAGGGFVSTVEVRSLALF